MVILLREESEREGADELGVVDHVKGFGKVNCHGQCAGWGTRLIKALSYFMCKR